VKTIPRPAHAIQMVDLKSQYVRLKSEIDSAIEEVFEAGKYIKGPQVLSFEQKLAQYTGSKHVISCANGTDALQIAMMALDLKPDDEVIIPAFTYVATAEVIALLGLTPVLADVDKNTFNLNPESFQSCISPKTKAVVPVHLFGQSADMQSILEISNHYGINVVEDNAQAIGCDYKLESGETRQCGTMGIIGTTSFFPSKNLGCYGDGGALFTSDEALATKIRMISNHGQKIQYQHDCIGVNSRLDTLQAAILEVKLNHLKEFIHKRQLVADGYDEALKLLDGIQIPTRDPKSSHVFHQYTLKLEGINRDALRAYLAEVGIPSMVYYPIPLHKQKAFESAISYRTSVEVSDQLCHQVLSLPMSPDLETDQIDYILYHIKHFIQHKS
jgi:dTDP-4-amino-4,6-dideoxygalactose transaminase